MYCHSNSFRNGCEFNCSFARRGLPKKILSDNGKTFKGAAKIIRTIMSNHEVREYLSGMNLEWQFNVERAPWWGGVFERMIGSTKNASER